jgi:hypothetical protein
MGELDKLRKLERQIEREWWWLNGALHAIAQVSSGDPGAYWQMLTQKRAVDRKRVEIATEAPYDPEAGTRLLRLAGSVCASSTHH